MQIVNVKISRSTVCSFSHYEKDYSEFESSCNAYIASQVTVHAHNSLYGSRYMYNMCCY